MPPTFRPRTNLSDPAQDGFAVTPADSDFAGNVACAALYIGVTGNVRVTTVKGTDLTFTAHPVGYMPVSVRRVWLTGTTASSIVGLK